MASKTFNKRSIADASALESAKTDLERMEDVAYTINHAIACSATDFIDPFVGNATQKWLGKRFSIGCGHDHGHFQGSDCGTHDHAHDHDHGKSHLGHWWLGELAGDFGSVPVTVAIQRHAPGVMNGLRKGMEAVAGGIFRKSAERSARKQATAFGMEASEAEIQQRADALYEHEMKHLPQAAVWTASSVVLNVGIQKLTGNTAPLWQVTAGKLSGVALSSGLMVGARALAPATAQKWDGYASEKLYLPATKKVSKLFGVDEKTVDSMVAKERAHDVKSWVARREEEKTGKDAPTMGRI